MLRISFILLGLTLLVSACAPQSPKTSGAFDPYQPSQQQQPVDTTDTLDQVPQDQPQIDMQKVAILLPLTGPHASIGQSLLNASQLALFDMDTPSIALVPLDTQGTGTGTQNAINKAISQRVNLILGPLLAQNVGHAGRAASRYNLNVIGFTTDSTKTGGNVFTVGILPYDQGRRLADYAGKNNLKRVVAIVPPSEYAKEVTRAFEQNAAQNGLTVTDTITLSQNDSYHYIAETLAAKKNTFDAILMPFGNPQIASMAQALNAKGLNASNVPWLGAGLWDDQTITSNSAMRGAVYAAPSPALRQDFERQYRTIYGENPKRLASLGYDATALAIVLLRNNSGKIERATLLNPNGFSGIDGVFRFKDNGMTERGLAIHKIMGPNRTQMIDQAPTTFRTQTTSTY